MQSGTHHFRCTQCGACCNRAPEVGLSEAAPLSDQFVFRLMFRLYWFPKDMSNRAGPADRNEVLHQKRHIEPFAARKTSARMKVNGKSVDCRQYLVMSAMPLDTPRGMCAALRDKACGIYERRPLACRTVPLHYSRAEALAERDLDAFSRRPGYQCDTDPSCEILLDGGRITDRDIVEARARAVDLALSDHAWNAAILDRMASEVSLPSLKQVHDNAPRGAMTTSMRVAWQIARDAGLFDTTAYVEALHHQLRLMDREIAMARASRDDLDTLAQMRVEYAQCLECEAHAPR